MLIAIGSLKNAPGVTTWSLALAVRWPLPMRSVLVECDPSGGSIATRFRLAPNPGLATLTAAARRDTNPHLLWSHVQYLPGGLPVLCAPTGAQFARTALATLLDSRDAVSVFRAAAVPNVVVIADCGRLDPGSPAMAVAREADRVLLLTRPRADDLCHLAADLAMVDLWSLRPHLVLVGPGHSATEVTRELGVPVAGAAPYDPAGARALSGYADPHRAARRGPRRSRLGRAALAVADALLDSPADRSRTYPSPLDRQVWPVEPHALTPSSSTSGTPSNGHRM
jgi:hypothetical protein